MTQIEGIHFFYNLTLNFQDCGPFKFLRERQFSSERPFQKSPLHKIYQSQNNLKHAFLKEIIQGFQFFYQI